MGKSRSEIYEDLLKDERWIKLRDKVLLRDNFQCRIKGCYSSSKNLDVHHLFYLDKLNPWEYSEDCLMTLCRFHHSQYHEMIKKQEELLCFTLKTKGFMLGDLLALSTLIHSDFEFTQNLLKTLREHQHG